METKKTKEREKVHGGYRKGLPSLVTIFSNNFEDIDLGALLQGRTKLTRMVNRNDAVGRTRLERRKGKGYARGEHDGCKTVSDQGGQSILSMKYSVSLGQTPSNMTPSQRLQFRRLQLNRSISQLNKDGNDYRKAFHVSTEDEDIDDLDPILNVPVCRPFVLGSRENNIPSDAEIDISSDDTRCSSIMSQASIAETETLGMYDGEKQQSVEDLKFTSSQSRIYNLNNSSVFSQDDVTRLAHLFSENETIRMHEESLQKKMMISRFKKLNLSLPSLSAQPDKSFIRNRTVKSNLMIEVKSFHCSNGSKSKKHQSEISQCYSFTRPIWLPPKSNYEKKKHHREFNDIEHHAIEVESKETRQKIHKFESLMARLQEDQAHWRQLLALNNNEFYARVRSPEVRDMYWRGISRKYREYVWFQMVGDKRKLEDSYNFALATFDASILPLLERPNRKSSNEDRSRRDTETELEQLVQNLLKKIELDISSASATSIRNSSEIWPTKKIIFLLLIFFTSYFKEIANITKEEVVSPCAYFKGLSNLVIIFYSHYRDEYKTFLSVADILTKGLLRAAYLEVFMKNAYEEEIDPSQLSIFFKDVKISLKGKNERLYFHLDSAGIDYEQLFSKALLLLFTDLFDYNLCCHIIDIYLFEGRSFLKKCLVGYLDKISYKLYGDQKEISDTVGRGVCCNNHPSIHRENASSPRVNIGYEHEFIEFIRQI